MGLNACTLGETLVRLEIPVDNTLNLLNSMLVVCLWAKMCLVDEFWSIAEVEVPKWREVSWHYIVLETQKTGEEYLPMAEKNILR